MQVTVLPHCRRGMNDKSLTWNPRHARNKDAYRKKERGIDTLLAMRERTPFSIIATTISKLDRKAAVALRRLEALPGELSESGKPSSESLDSMATRLANSWGIGD